MGLPSAAVTLHASEAVAVPGPIPPSGTGRAVTRFTDIWDESNAAVIWSETTVTSPGGTLLWTQKRSIFARGEGGFGGERGLSTSAEPPQRAPDLEVPLPILPQQALLYRLCGDRNPLHSDPKFAVAAGFPRPILHGLCTYGMTCKAMVDNLIDGDTARVGSYGARFAGVVFPGQTLKASIWKDGDGFQAVVTAPERDDATVLSGVELVRARAPLTTAVGCVQQGVDV